MFIDRSKSRKPSLEKGHQRNIPVKFRISSCPYSAVSPHSPEQCLWTDQNFVNHFERGHPKNIPVKVFQNLFQRRKFFKELLKKVDFVAMATRDFVNIVKLCENFLKRTSQGTFLPSLVQNGPAVWEMLKEIVDDGHGTTLTAAFEHVVLS